MSLLQTGFLKLKKQPAGYPNGLLQNVCGGCAAIKKRINGEEIFMIGETG